MTAFERLRIQLENDDIPYELVDDDALICGSFRIIALNNFLYVSGVPTMTVSIPRARRILDIVDAVRNGQAVPA